MKWTGMVALLLAVAAVASAETPNPTTIRMSQPRGPLYSASTWWARFGEPANQDALDAAPAEVGFAPAGDHGHGYVYGSGSCDHTPACTGWQWSDYNPMPLRCLPLSARRHHGRCGDDCGGCSQCGRGHVGLFHKKADCGCAAPAPDCAAKMPTCEAAPSCEAAPACGCDVATSCCKKRHFHWHWKGLGFWNKHCGCDTCATSCGCEAPAGGYDAPSIDVPGVEQAPQPLPEETTKAASLVWPFGNER